MKRQLRKTWKVKYCDGNKRDIHNACDTGISLQITDVFDWQPHSNDSVHSMGSMMVDEDYMEFMSDTLFSTISANQPYAFPDQREISMLLTVLYFKNHVVSVCVCVCVCVCQKGHACLVATIEHEETFWKYF